METLATESADEAPSLGLVLGAAGGSSGDGEDTEIHGLGWLSQTACGDMAIDDFFVEAGHAIEETALQVCRGCPVRIECVKHAYDMQVTGGYFGGLSPGQRRERSLEEAVQLILRSTKSASASRNPA
jgi:hypothetical protein